jgi:hypothetical protein
MEFTIVSCRARPAAPELTVDGDRGFESRPLQRRVLCEPHAVHINGAEIRLFAGSPSSSAKSTQTVSSGASMPAARPAKIASATAQHATLLACHAVGQGPVRSSKKGGDGGWVFLVGSEPAGGVARRVCEGLLPSHHLGEQPPGGGSEREAVMGMAEGEPQALVPLAFANHRDHVGKTGPPAHPRFGLQPFG